MSMAAENFITEHLDLWTAAIKRKSSAGRGSSSKIDLYGIKKLRELILELAVRGLLVPQDLDDEPASELLKKIAAEKAKLVKDGKVKKDKPLPPVAIEEQPFLLPKGWAWSRLADLALSQAGFAFKANFFNEAGEGRPLIRIRDVGQPFSGTYYSGDYRDEFLVESGDYLISMDGNFRVAPWVGDCALLNQRVSRLIFYSKNTSQKFIAESLQFRLRELQGIKAYTTVDHLSGGQISQSVIPIPPLAEQHRIVAKVDELMALCDQLEKEIDASLSAHQTLVETLLNALTSAADHAQFASAWQRIAEHFDSLFTTEESIDQLKKATLSTMANGALVEFPKGSRRVPLKKILSFGPRNGFSPKESQLNTNKSVLKLGATSYGRLNLSQVKFFEEDVPPESHLWLQRGDILVQRGNSHYFVGSNVVIEEDVENVIYPDLMMKLRVNEDALPEYISLFLSAPQVREHMWERMTGTSGTMPKISKGVVEDITVLLPPTEIQEKVISTVRLLFTICDQLQSALGDARTTQSHLADAVAERALLGA